MVRLGTQDRRYDAAKSRPDARFALLVNGNMFLGFDPRLLRSIRL